MYIIYYHMGVFVSDFVSARSSPRARVDTDCEGRYKVRYKNTHMIIMLSLMYCDLY